MIGKRGADRLIKAYGRIARGLPFLLLRPIIYYCYLTQRCNLKCSYCWQKSPVKKDSLGYLPEKELNAEEWIKVINRIPRPSAIGFSGGEPLIFKGFMDVFKAAAKRFPVTINTNGLELGEQYAELFVTHGLKNLSISLDGLASVHDESRVHSGLFDSIDKNVKQLRKIKRRYGKRNPSLTVKMTLTNEGVEDLEAFCDFCEKELEANSVVISLLKSTDHAQFSHFIFDEYEALQSAGIPFVPPYENAETVVEKLAAIQEKYSNRKMQVIVYPGMNSKEQIRNYLASQGKAKYQSCTMPWVQTVIMPSGKVVPCMSLGLGDIAASGFDAISVLKEGKYEKFLRILDGKQKRSLTPEVCLCCCYLDVIHQECQKA